MSATTRHSQRDSNRDIFARTLLGAARSLTRKPQELRYHVARELWSVTKRFASSNVRNVPLCELPCLQDAVVAAYIDDPNRAVLAALCREVGARSFFEIGTNRGRTAWTVARNNPTCRVYTLDLPSPDAVVALDINDSDRDFFGDDWASGEAFAGTAEAERITALYGDSATFDFTPFANSIDLVFIDGAHSYSYVRSDTAAALSMLAPSGTIVWDDYPAIPGVYRFLNELAAEQVHPLMHVFGTRLVISTPHDLVGAPEPGGDGRSRTAR